MERRSPERVVTSELTRPVQTSYLSELTEAVISFHRYFGRARELPGVKEMFAKKGQSSAPRPTSRAHRARAHAFAFVVFSTYTAQGGDEESQRAEIYKRYRNQGPAYYGDMDEADGAVLKDDRASEEKDWKSAYDRLATILSLDPSASPMPSFPRPTAPPPASASSTATPSTSTKRSATDATPSADVDMADASDASDAPNKTAKLDGDAPVPTGPKSGSTLVNAGTSSAEAVAFEALGVLKQEDLVMPVLLGKAEMEKIVLDARKKALLAEYL